MNDDDWSASTAHAIRAIKQESAKNVLDDVRRLLSRGHVPDDVWEGFKLIERKHLA